MGCRIRRLKSGKLALGLQWVLRGRSVRSQVDFGVQDTPRARAVLERDYAGPIAAEMCARRFDERRYLDWFPHGSLAAEFRRNLGMHGPAATAAAQPAAPLIRERYATWIQRQVPPYVRAAQARDYRQHMTAYVLPSLGDVRLNELAAEHLFDLRQALSARSAPKPLKAKTVRNIIDATFRAFYRDARNERLVAGDPFAVLTWPRVAAPQPDPFTREEREAIREWFAGVHGGHYGALIDTLFLTGMRPSEAVALRVGDVDFERRQIRICKSRYLGQEAATKTRGSERTIEIKASLAARVRAAVPMDAGPDDYVFRNLKGGPIDQREWPKDHWHRCLEGLTIRHRKWYATRHTFISLTLSDGADALGVAEYAGTSLQMLGKSYAKYMPRRGRRGVLDFIDEGEGGEEAKTQSVRRPIAFRAKKLARMLASPTGFEPVLPT